MRTLIISLAIVTVTVQATQAQITNVKDTLYGFSISQFKSGSGFQSGYEAQFTVQSANKSKLGFGIFIDYEGQNKISGATATHQRFLFTRNSNFQNIQPFLFYNFVYRITKTSIALQETDLQEKPEISRYSSMEHHLGIGVNIKISRNIYIDCGLGYGLFLGSIRQPSEPDAITGRVSGTNGKSLILKSGIGFSF